MNVTVSVALYVSGHGFGHAVRSAEVARVLLGRGHRVLVRSEAPAWLFHPGVEHLSGPEGAPVDVGVAQHDGLEFDIDETRSRWTAFDRVFDDLVEQEATTLHAARAEVVIGDVPPLAFAAAARAGLPSYALTNFGWDWIYAAWPGFEPIVARVQAAYREATALLRLPLHSSAPDAFPAFQSIEDVPLITRHAKRTSGQVRAELGIRPEATAVLLSFGGFHARGLDLDALGEWRAYVFLLTPPLASGNGEVPDNVLRLPVFQPDYPSLVAACDAVVTKPGYGIVADCLANRVPVLYTDRGPFREYDVLAEALETLGPARYAPQADILDGRLGPHLDALLQLDTPWTDQPMDGAERVADLVRSLPLS